MQPAIDRLHFFAICKSAAGVITPATVVMPAGLEWKGECLSWEY